METFFVCGTPRSRTAWLANFLTTNNVYCFHELLVYCKTPTEIKDEFLKTRKNIVGNSDSGNILFIDELKAEFPKSKIVLIKRNRDEVIQSLKKTGFLISYQETELNGVIDYIIEEIENTRKKYECLYLDYNDLVSADCCKEIYEYCTGLSFDYDRWFLLSTLNIQVQKEVEMKRIDKLMDNKELFVLNYN